MTRKIYTAIIEEDPETGDALLPFPPEMLEELSWVEGDTLTWTVKTNELIILSEKAVDD